LRFNQSSLSNHGDILGPRRGICWQTCLAGWQEDMRGKFFVNARRQWHNEDSIGALMSISSI